MMFSIGEIAAMAGVATSTLRYYENIGILPPPRRINGRRQYDAVVLQLLAIIQLAKDATFTLEEIDELINGFDETVSPSHRFCTIAQRKLQEVNAIIRQAQETKYLLEDALTCQFLQFELDQSALGKSD